ncbi:phosphoenolpyruvate synthase [bacterium BMS3Bbin03]|nr:phosphoenolpyruvate synthase [bacterium BMS3Bbin03]
MTSGFEKIPFTQFKPDFRHLPHQIEVIGNGEVGGKGKGLLFVAIEMEKEGVLSDFPAQKIHIPKTQILTTEIFDRFQEANRLKGLYRKVDYEELKEIYAGAEFPQDIQDRFREILETMTYPLAIRSSSIMEDSLEHSFAGLYFTVFIANQGDLEKRLKEFMGAVKRVFVSTYNPSVYAYRKKHGLRSADDKMAILVQKMIGKTHDHFFFPLFSGVGFSRNFYPWNQRVQVQDGVIRLVYGLGTRAVGRNYARVFSLSNPQLRPEGSITRDIIRYSQEIFDALDLDTNELVSLPVKQMKNKDRNLYKIASILKDGSYLSNMYPMHLSDKDRIVVTFDPIIGSNHFMAFVDIIRDVLVRLETLFGIPVDIEFSVDFETNSDTGKEEGIFYLLQARPLGVREAHKKIEIPQIPRERVIVEASQPLGNGVKQNIHHIIYIATGKYLEANPYEVARKIGRLNQRMYKKPYILIGPGRWGSSNPQLGVPVRYGEISNASVIVEVASGRLTPELSYGTHFFGDMLSDEMFYIPVFPQKGDFINKNWLKSQKNYTRSNVVHLIEIPEGIQVIASGNEHRALIFTGSGSIEQDVPDKTRT